MRTRKALALVLTFALLLQGAQFVYATDSIEVPNPAIVDEALPENQGGSVDAESNVGTVEGVESGIEAIGAAESNAGAAEAVDGQDIDNQESTVVPFAGGELSISTAQQGTSTMVTISLPGFATIVSANSADRVTVSSSMSYKGVETRKITAQKTIGELTGTSGSFDMDFTTYGKFTVTATFYKNNVAVASTAAQTVNIIANEYNIAPISATLPVTFFSISLWGTNNLRTATSGEPIPTIMLMERPSAWNWDQLPAGVYPLPYLTQQEVAYQPPVFSEAAAKFMKDSEAMTAYVTDLYAANPSARFNLYVCDYYLGLIQSILYANKIPQSQYSITVLSDGSFSYTKFSAVYSDPTPQATHATLVTNWNNAKTQAYATGKVTLGFTLNAPNNYLYAAVVSEPGARWWLARPALLTTGGDNNALGQLVQANTAQVIRINIAPMLSALGQADLQEFKALYNFSSTYFADAEAEGKKVMLFLGTTVGNESAFSEYARFVMAYYGDEYAYYYKGHPGTPTDMYPAKQDQLDYLGTPDVDSSIAAELILFFYPDICLAGYSSSTYASVTNPDMAKGLFNRPKADALADITADYAMMDFFITQVTNSSSSAIRNLCRDGVASYLVEFSDTEAAAQGSTIAIWEPGTTTITYYKLVGGSYVKVKQTVNSKIVTIGSKLNKSKVFDLQWASKADGGNLWLYGNNESPAQRFRLNPVSNGYYEIVNCNSGKLLDVQWAGTEAGTNVWQYGQNGTLAQLWQLVDTGEGDGSCYLVSKPNGLYLDATGGKSVDGTNLQVWPRNETAAQKFFVNEIKPLVTNGVYEIQSQLDKNMVLDVRGAGKASGTNIQLYRSNETDAQRFNLRFDTLTGYYTIENVGSGKVVDVQGAGTQAGTNVWQYSSNGTDAQKWSLVRAGGSTYYLYCATGTGCCLDVSGAKKSNETNIQIWSPNGTNAQKWLLDKIE
jgi:hypothetical protein